MDDEAFQADVLALRKLYGLLRLDSDSPPNELDDNSRHFLKSLLDNATGKVLEAHAKIIWWGQPRDTADLYHGTIDYSNEQQTPVLQKNQASTRPNVSGCPPPFPCNISPDVGKESMRSSDVLLQKEGALSLDFKPMNMVSSSDLSSSKLTMNPVTESGRRIKRCRVCGKRKAQELVSPATPMQINGSDSDRISNRLLSNNDHLNPRNHPESNRSPDYCATQAPPFQMADLKQFPSQDKSPDDLQSKGVEQIRFSFGSNAGSVTKPGASKPPLHACTGGRDSSNDKAAAGVHNFSKEVDDAIKRLDSFIIPSLQQLVAKPVQAPNNISGSAQQGNCYGMAGLTPRANLVSPVLKGAKDKLLVASREMQSQSSKSLVFGQDSPAKMIKQRTDHEESERPDSEWLSLLQGNNLNHAGYQDMQTQAGSVTENQVRGEGKWWNDGATSEKETYLLNDAISRSSKQSPFADKLFDLETSERHGGAKAFGSSDDTEIQVQRYLSPAKGIQQIQRMGSGKNVNANVERIGLLERQATRYQNPDQMQGLRILPSQLTTKQNQNQEDHITRERTIRRTKMSRPPTPAPCVGSTSFRRRAPKSYSPDCKWDKIEENRNPEYHIAQERTSKEFRQPTPAPSIGSTSFRRRAQKTYSPERKWDETEENRSPECHITQERTRSRSKMSRQPTPAPSIGSKSFQRIAQKNHSTDSKWDHTGTGRAFSSSSNQKRQTFRKSTLPLHSKHAPLAFASSVANRNNTGKKEKVERPPRKEQPLSTNYEDLEDVGTSWDSASSSSWTSQQDSASSYTSYSETDDEPSGSWDSSEGQESYELLPAPKARHQYVNDRANVLSSGSSSSEYGRSNTYKDYSSVVGSSHRVGRTKSYKSERQIIRKKGALLQARHQHLSHRAQLVSSGSSSSEYDGSSSFKEDSSVVGSARRVGRAKSFKSEHRVVHEKGAGRLRKIKNKLGLILHHHHHHHHHHHGDGDDEAKTGDSKSIWKKMFQHTSKKTYHHDQNLPRSEKARRAVVKGEARNQQLGHFHALVEGLLKHVKHSKKSKKGKDRRMGQQPRDDRPHGGGKVVCRKLNWGPKVGGRNGVKVNNKARVKIGGRSKKPQLAAAKMILKK